MATNALLQAIPRTNSKLQGCSRFAYRIIRPASAKAKYVGLENRGKRPFCQPDGKANLAGRMQTGTAKSKRQNVVGSAEPGAAHGQATRCASTRAGRRSSGNLALHTPHEVNLVGAAAIPRGAAVL